MVIGFLAFLLETPLEFLLRKMRDTTAALADRFQVAKAAAPFCHPQLQAVAHWFSDFDKELYNTPHRDFACKLKQFRAIATRYDKTARNFLAAIHLAATAILLN